MSQPPNQAGKSIIVTDTGDRRALFDQFLRCIDREENLIHYRITWGLQWNIGCLAALVALYVSQPAMHYIPWYAIGLGIFGGSASVLSTMGVLAAQDQTAYLIKMLNWRLGVSEHRWEETEFIRPYGDHDSVHRKARRVSTFIHTGFIFIWLFVIVFSINNIK